MEKFFKFRDPTFNKIAPCNKTSSIRLNDSTSPHDRQRGIENNSPVTKSFITEARHSQFGSQMQIKNKNLSF